MEEERGEEGGEEEAERNASNVSAANDSFGLEFMSELKMNFLRRFMFIHLADMWPAGQKIDINNSRFRLRTQSSHPLM